MGQSDQDQKPKHSGLQAGLSGRSKSKSKAGTIRCRSWLAGDGINWVYLKNRGVCIAGKPAPTEKQSCSSFRFGFRFGF
jgi:ribosome modulation factor